MKIAILHLQGLNLGNIIVVLHENEQHVVVRNGSSGGIVAYVVCNGGVVRLDILIFIVTYYSPVQNNHFSVAHID